jgi:hypothetical protein
MEKIIVTEAKAKIIKAMMKAHSDSLDRLESIMRKTGLGIVTVARIVNGEEYEVEYEFKLGDLVKCEKGYVYEICDHFNGVSTTLRRMEDMGLNRYKLVCKFENRADLNEEDMINGVL